MKKSVFFGLLSLVVFGAYLQAVNPSVAAYRDSGEMVTAAKTLGVAHPPGYPLYVIAAKAATFLPLGNPSYRLNVFSALAVALATALLALWLSAFVPTVVAGLTALLWAQSSLLWSVGVVSEMYALGLVFLIGVFALLARKDERFVFLAAFLYGLGLGVRMDLSLAAPALAWLAWDAGFRFRRKSLVAICFFALGFSVFAYLPIRSLQDPILDWNDPETLGKLWGTITRKTHGGTLDLLSKNYKTGELFLTDLGHYGRHLLDAFTWVGAPLALFGLFLLWRRHRVWAQATVIGFFFYAPLFLFLSNMPPNPHALAILEAHYLLPDLFVILWVGVGLAALATPRTVLVLFCLLLLRGGLSVHRFSKRHSYYAHDYAKNVLRLAPPGAVVAAQEDVQLFSLWTLQRALGYRTDVAVVSQGLSGTPWHLHALGREYPKVNFAPVHNPEDWRVFLEANQGLPVLATYDANLLESAAGRPWGLTFRLDTQKETRSLDPWTVRRGVYRYGETPDFFTSDLVEEYSKAAHADGYRAMTDKNYAKAKDRFFLSRAFKPDFAPAYFHRGYCFLVEGRWEEARREYLLADARYQEILEETKVYHTLPEVVRSIEHERAELLTHLNSVSRSLEQKSKKP